jgi:glycine oxidase
MRGAGIVVAGAGAFGSVIALRLAEAGARVLVIDPAPAGANASGLAAGMLAPAFEALFDAKAAPPFDLMREARDLWPALADRIGLPLDRSGAVAIGAPEEAATWEESLAGLGAEAHRLSSEALCGLTPAPRPDSVGVYSPEEWRLSPAFALRALHRAARGTGVGFFEGEVRDFARGPLGISVAGKATADWLIVATGASRLLRNVAPELTALSPIKGHILRTASDLPAGPTLRSPDVYVCLTGAELILGATMEFGVAGGTVDRAVAAGLEAAGARLCPSLGTPVWRPAAGVRAATPDGAPFVGPSATPGVVLAVGARRNGWLLAPLVAEIVADIISGRARSAAARSFDPARATARG